VNTSASVSAAPSSCVIVVVPARDERESIGRCPDSILLSRERALAIPSSVRVTVCVVADRCLDDTSERAKQFAQVEVIAIAAGRVGIARATGIHHAVTNVDFDKTWIATTDADSTVPANWIDCQLALAAGGADVLVGTVRPVFADLPRHQVRKWLTRHIPGRPNGHVHGTNLGFRANPCETIGSFRALDEHEDVDLVRRLAGCGYRLVSSDDCEVLTSSRRVGRTPGGYAAYLARGDVMAEGS
jgi:hypothetical protein